MTIHRTPDLSAETLRLLEELDVLRQDIRYRVDVPARWSGALRRVLASEATRSSTGIEGFRVSEEEALAIAAGRPVPDVDERTALAIRDYQAAFDRVVAYGDDEHFTWTRSTIRELHYLVTQSEERARPGRWRRGGVWITGPENRVIYEGPAAEVVPALMDETADWLAEDSSHPIVRAAMAHFHVASIHPFADGNGRTARIVQSLVLARERILHPAFASIERYLGENTPSYYDALQAAHGSAYDPTTSTAPWLDFAVRAHRSAAERLVATVAEASRRFDFVTELVAAAKLPERAATALDIALMGLEVRRDEYRHEHGVGTAAASHDLTALTRLGWLERRGGGRNVHYVATATLSERYRSTPGGG